MIEAFRQWFESRRSKLAQAGISLDIRPESKELSPYSIHADLRSKRYEWLAQLWEYGFSDFHFLDWEQMDSGVEVTHYEFETEEELLSSLESMLERMYSDSESGPSEAKPEGV